MRTIACLALVLSCACSLSQGGKPAEAAPDPQPAPSAPGRLEYEQAKNAVMLGDHRRAMELFAAAADKDASVCEYWYQLGAAETNLAIDVVYESDSEAVRLYEHAVDHKTEALRLLNEGKCAIWTPAQVEQVRHEAQMGLRDAEDVLRDKTSLVIALRMYADQRAR